MTRRVFDDSSGEHVAKPSTITADEVFEPLVEVFAVKCPRCDAEPHQPCVTLVGTRKDRVYPHPARVELARRSK